MITLPPACNARLLGEPIHESEEMKHSDRHYHGNRATMMTGPTTVTDTTIVGDKPTMMTDYLSDMQYHGDRPHHHLHQ